MAEFATPQASFYGIDFFSSLKVTKYPATPAALPSQKMSISLLNNFKREEHHRIQV